MKSLVTDYTCVYKAAFKGTGGHLSLINFAS